MKVLFLALGFFRPEGGMERYNQRVMRALSELIEDKSIENATILSLWDDSTSPKTVSGVCFHGFASNKLKALFSFFGRLYHERPDIILYGHILFAPLALVAKVIYPKGKSILFAYGVEVWKKPSRINRWVCSKGFDRFFAISQYTASMMLSSYQFPADRVSILFAATDYDPAEKLPTKTIKLNGTHNILSVSRLSTSSLHKNIDKVIEAMPEILEQFPDTHYYIIGDGDWRKELKDLCITCGVDKRVHFAGRLDDPERDAYYEASDIFILPSVGEGFGIVFLEAWKYHLPVVTSNQGAAPEVVENGNGGFCVDPDPKMIAQGVTTLLSDQGLCKRMGAFGYQKLTTFYTHKRFRDQLSEYLCQSF